MGFDGDPSTCQDQQNNKIKMKCRAADEPSVDNTTRQHNYSYLIQKSNEIN